MHRIATVFLAATIAATAPLCAQEPAKADPAAAERQKGVEFLAKLDAQEGVQKKPSGLRIKIVQPGEGASPQATDTVKVHYRGTLLDGKEFDSSYKRGQPATFALNRVVPCWTEGVPLLKPGGKATLYCPSEIAYGDRGYPGVIPPGAFLTFEVELVGIEGGQN
jgi:FKBP-type peptidyl-prolyl cis-trans isomerase FkpA